MDLLRKNHQPGDKQTGGTIRTFVCIEIPDSIKERISRLQETLRNTTAQISWTRSSNIHLTLKFLGGVKASRIERAGKALELAASGIGPFEVEIGGTGCFPSSRNPRVLWVGVPNVPEELRRLHANIEDELARVGFEREKRKFSPHLTIGRVRSPLNSAGVVDTLLATGFVSETFLATELILMRSDLRPTGSIYTPQSIARLS